ncbi:glycine--tRNA ligase subunit beta [Rhodobacter veldkampii DSM 11550]|uniref:Glycine--tRNA ligase beta subunit n=1 Tax=Phaeovulum veldkampii DSM 11550 TaxID=1185920 RepID=A0A2T4JHE0_9RHOB|nr:glycine--tRNA ligase subunit beta [Phaeovulum veldkampii]MBK5945578.1 glycine--tRNA ligase subunit beta [Phaeovulum veldkampii DSM 11550]PTE17316.1 glycine--tRNA ligase subunit beta [Phaeovulum veldkampii DSM 11550]TDQ56340.1 glycyl-tRNA synthetase beta chain [Phaeovulum veldkampii DSM 11550]
MPDLLIELFSEEIPARMQGRARDDLRRLVTDGLVAAGLTYASAGAFSTPRRLVLTIEGLSAQSPTLREERKGPKADAPAAAIEGFVRSTGLTRDQLELRDDKKGQVYFAVLEKPGRPAGVIVAEVLEETIRTFPWPKSMRWGTGTLRWVRPLHSILCILTDEAGAQTVPLEVEGITAANTTAGHRFLSPGRFAVTSFDDYRAKLKRAHVVLDSAEREAMIWAEAGNLAFARGLEVVEDRGLLTEVAGLVEWPVVLMGEIGEEFLSLPPEVLQTSMREHQKFFSVKNPRTGRIEGFVTVANNATADHGATILKGNRKVLSARLSDARFFWENDLRTVTAQGLEGMGAGLAHVTFHNKLGSQADRVARIAALAREIAPLVGAQPDLAAEAARVVKADLQSAMVGEFPELQGVMGGYYARAAGLPEAVANACKAHYSPLGPSDEVPTDPVSVAVALADKIDTLTGFWWIDEKPTGSKDPFALRRAALGVVRLVLANKVRLRLLDVILAGYEPFDRQLRWELECEEQDADVEAAKRLDVPVSVFQDWRSKIAQEKRQRNGPSDFERRLFEIDLSNVPHPGASLLAFFHDRLKVYLRDQGIRHDVIDACLAMPGNDDLTLLVKRAEALAAFLKSDDGTNLIQGFKRANNILTQAEAKDGVEYSYGADPKFAETEEERALFAALDAAEAAIAPAMQAEDFAAAMAAMAALRGPIDAFFTAVQINTDNAVVRRNRLNLLSRIRQTCLSVADLTRIEG